MPLDKHETSAWTRFGKLDLTRELKTKSREQIAAELGVKLSTLNSYISERENWSDLSLSANWRYKLYTAFSYRASVEDENVADKHLKNTIAKTGAIKGTKIG